MRHALIAVAGLAVLAGAACNKDGSADAHLKQAGREAKAAATDVGKAIDSAAPAVTAAGHDVGKALDKADAEAQAAGRKAGDQP